MDTFTIFNLVLAGLALFLLGGLCASSDKTSYRQGVEDAYGYLTEPFDKKYAEAAYILRGKPLPPLPEE